MQFKITRVTRGMDLLVCEFKDLNDARMMVQKLLAADRNLNVENIYRIFDFDDMLNEYNTKDAAPEVKTNAGTGTSSSGKGSGYNPTPFSTAPRAPGTAPSWTTSDSDEEEKN